MSIPKLASGAFKVGAMTWPRPVPVVGDQSFAAQRAAGPVAWAFPEAARLALHDIVAARRDIRRFRPDAVPPEVLERVLTAGHAAPSVGHSQPWRFLVVEDAELRTRAAMMADTERLAQRQGGMPSQSRWPRRRVRQAMSGRSPAHVAPPTPPPARRLPRQHS